MANVKGLPLQTDTKTLSQRNKRSRASSKAHNLEHVPEDPDNPTCTNPTPSNPHEQTSVATSDDLTQFPGERNREWLIARIEKVFEQQADGILASSQHLAVTVKSRPKRPEEQTAVVRKFQFPGRHEQDAWRYTVIIRILELVHNSLVTDTIITKRDIYYRDPALFSKQSVVDRFVDDLAFTFGVPRILMNVTATAKGLIAGCFVIHESSGNATYGISKRNGLLINILNDGDKINIEQVKWVLVVEKEATFRSLVTSSFWDCLSAHGLLVTGKGFPDIATRVLLRSIALPALQNNFAQPPVYALVDYDPDGLEILSTYKHGSLALAHETAGLVLPSIRRLGVSSNTLGSGTDLHQIQGLLSLRERDRRKAVRMLERKVFNTIELEWRRELQVMLMLNMKAEIQILEATQGGLIEWLRAKGIN